MIRVLVVAPLPALRAGLRALLRSDEAVEVIGEAQGLAQARRGEVDVAVVMLDSVHGWLVSGHQPAEAVPPLLLLTDEPAALSAVATLSPRAWGVLSPDAGPEELTAAVRALHAGLLVGAPALLAPLLSARLSGAERELEPLAESLTAREIEVLELLAQGLANKQIAALLTISEHTVKFHVSAIYAKLGATNRTEAVRLGAARGLVVL